MIIQGGFLLFWLISCIRSLEYIQVRHLEHQAFAINREQNVTFEYLPTDKEKQISFRLTNFTTAFSSVNACFRYNKPESEAEKCDEIKEFAAFSDVQVFDSGKLGYFVTLYLNSSVYGDVYQQAVFYEDFEDSKTITSDSSEEITGLSKTNKRTFFFHMNMSESLHLHLNQENKNNSIRMRFISVYGMRLLKDYQSNKSFTLHFDDITSDNETKYVLLVYSDSETPITEKATIKIVLNYHEIILLDKEENKLVKEVETKRNSLYFKINTGFLDENREFLVTAGFNKYNESSTQMFKKFRYNCRIQKDSYDPQMPCAHAYDGSNEDKMHHHYTFKAPDLHPVNFLLLDSFELLEPLDGKKIKYYISVSKVKEITLQDSLKEVQFNAKAFVPLLFKASFYPESSFEEVYLYSTLKKPLRILKGHSLSEAYTNYENQVEPVAYYKLKKSDLGESDSFFIEISSDEDAEGKLIFTQNKRNVEHFSVGKRKNILYQINSCFQDHFYSFTNFKYEKLFWFFKVSDDDTQNTNVQKKEGITGISDAFSSERLQVFFREKIYEINSVDGVFKVSCQVPTIIEFIFFNEDSVTLSGFGQEYLHFNEKGKIKVSDIKKGGVTLENLGDEEVSVSFGTEQLKIDAGESKKFDNITEGEFELQNEKGGFVKATIETSDVSEVFDTDGDLTSIEATPNERTFVYKIPTEKNLKYLEMKVNISDNFFAYYATKSSSSPEDPYEIISKNESNSYSTILISTLNLEREEDKDLYLILVGKGETPLTKVEVTQHEDVDIFGQKVSGSNFINVKGYQDNYVLSVNKGDEIAFVCQACSKSTSPNFMITTGKKRDANTKYFMLPFYYNLIKYVANDDFIQFGIKDPDILSNINDTYNGASCSFIINPTEADENNINKYITIQKNVLNTKVIFDYDDNTFRWDAPEQGVTYQLASFNPISSSAGNKTNVCYLNEKISSMKPTNQTENSYTISGLIRESLIVSVLVDSPVHMRLLFPLGYAEKRDTFNPSKEYPTATKSFEEEFPSIELQNADDLKWKYITIECKDPRYDYHYNTDSSSKTSRVTLPFPSEEALVEKTEKSKLFVLQNPYTSKADPLYYFTLSFVFASFTNVEINWNYVNDETQYEKLVPDENKYYFYSNEDLSGKKFVFEGMTKPSMRNEVVVVAKKCHRKTEEKISFYSFDALLKEELINTTYTPLNFTTYTDVFIKFSTATNETQHKNEIGFFILTNPEESELKKITTLIKDEHHTIYYNKKTDEISWEPVNRVLDSEFSYRACLIETLPSNQEFVDNVDNECFYSALDINNLPEGVRCFDTKENFLNNSSFSNHMHIVVLATITKPYPLRIMYKSKLIEGDKYEHFSVGKGQSIKIKKENKNVVFNLGDGKDISYFTIIAKSVNYKFYLKTGTFNSEDYNTLPLLSDAEKKMEDKTYRFVYQIPKALEKPMFYYYAMRFTNEFINGDKSANIELEAYGTKEENDTQIFTDESGVFFSNSSGNAFIKPLGDNINFETKLTFVAKSCSSENEFSVYSGAENLVKKSLQSSNEIFSLSTYTDLRLRLESNSTDTGYVISLGSNLTDEKISELNGYISKEGKLSEPSINKTTLKWEAIEGAEYEVYIYPVEDKNSSKSDCYLMANKNSSEMHLLKPNEASAVIPGAIKNNTLYQISVVAVIHTPLSFRISYKPLFYEGIPAKSKFKWIIISVVVSLIILVILIAVLLLIRKKKFKKSDEQLIVSSLDPNENSLLEK